MRLSFYPTVAAISILASSVYAQILTPTAAEVVSVNEAYTITWNRADLHDPVNLYLLPGGVTDTSKIIAPIGGRTLKLLIV